MALTGVVGVHDTCVVEDDVDATPCVGVLDHGGDVGFFADVADDGVDFAVDVRAELLDLGRSRLESGS